MMMTRQRSTSESNPAEVLTAGESCKALFRRQERGPGVERRVGNGE